MYSMKVFSILIFAVKIEHIDSLVSSHLPSLLVPCYNGKFSMKDPGDVGSRPASTMRAGLGGKCHTTTVESVSLTARARARVGVLFANGNSCSENYFGARMEISIGTRAVRDTLSTVVVWHFPLSPARMVLAGREPTSPGSMKDKPPLTKTLLIEILRKIELNEKSNINMRILTNTLLHEVIFDGVLKSDKVVKDGDALLYRARGHQFHKYKLVTDYFASEATTLSLNESLNQNEICFLHNMLSITINKMQRGDEETTCRYNFSEGPVPTAELELQNSMLSSCPLMKGDLITKWGTITPGHLIYGLIATVDNTSTSFDTIIAEMGIAKTKFSTGEANSLWISTLAGDLAEALLNQASDDIKLGIHGFWNDSILPLNYYLSDSSSDLTESILIGGIDSIIIGTNFLTWKKPLMTTRLSQIIDMYYSDRGIAYNPLVKASNRKIVYDILKKTNLKQQVIGAATLLKEIGNYDRFLSDNDISELATLMVNKFREKLDDILKPYDSIEYIDEIQPRSSLEIILILDGSFDYFTSKKIIYSLAEAIDVSIYGSKLGIINGQTGEWISGVTEHIFDIFNDIKLSENSWPTKLSLHDSFETVLEYYKAVMNDSCENAPKKPMGRAIVILSNKARPENHDLDAYKFILSVLKNKFPDVNILYALEQSVQEFFFDLPNRYLNDSFLNISGNAEIISSSIGKMLQIIPGQTINTYCDKSNSKMEDYLTPGIERYYEIHEEYTEKYNFEIQFIGNDYGNISVCSYSFSSGSSEEKCEIVAVNKRLLVKSKDLCQQISRCNIQFVLKVNSSTFSCAENDCRYPDQVRLDITWTKSGTSSVLTNTEFPLVIFCLTLIHCFMYFDFEFSQ